MFILSIADWEYISGSVPCRLEFGGPLCDRLADCLFRLSEEGVMCLQMAIASARMLQFFHASIAALQVFD